MNFIQILFKTQFLHDSKHTVVSITKAGRLLLYK
jgi:hypothetical protein